MISLIGEYHFDLFCYLLAITAFDAIKGSVDAGKRRRGASEGEDWKPGDFFLGLVQAAGEATRDGAAKRGRQQGEGNIIDWAVGATSNSADYVKASLVMNDAHQTIFSLHSLFTYLLHYHFTKENKNRLGSAGVGGGGFLVGMALGGPIGAIVG